MINWSMWRPPAPYTPAAPYFLIDKAKYWAKNKTNIFL